MAGAADDPEELALVRLAISLSHVTGCFEWDDRSASRHEERPPAPGLLPAVVRQMVIDYVVGSGGEVRQIPEKRREWSDFPFYYKVLAPVPGLRRGLFVEMRLIDNDPDYPIVHIVSAHP